MRQRQVTVGLLMVAALGLGLVPAAGNAADPWACAAVWNPAPGMNSCTVTSTIAGGALYLGAVEIRVNGVLRFFQYNSLAYHFSTLPFPPGNTGPEAANIGFAGATVKATSLSPGGWVIVGSRGM